MSDNDYAAWYNKRGCGEMTLTQDELGNIMQTITSNLSVSIPDRLKKVILYGSYARGDYLDLLFAL